MERQGRINVNKTPRSNENLLDVNVNKENSHCQLGCHAV